MPSRVGRSEKEDPVADAQYLPEALPATRRYPVLVVPGYGAPAMQNERVCRHLRSGGLDTVSIRLPWMAMGDMTRSAGILAEQAVRTMEERGFERVNILGFSIGGLIARYYLQEMEGYPSLGRGAFVSTPHAGTYFGYLGFFSPAGRQVRPGTPFIRNLNEHQALQCFGDRCLSIFVRWDGVVVPSVSSYLACGFNMPRERPVSHWRSTTSRELISFAAEFIRGDLPAGAIPGRELGMIEAGGLFPVHTELGRRANRRFWIIAFRPLRSFASRLAGLFRR